MSLSLWLGLGASGFAQQGGPCLELTCPDEVVVACAGPNGTEVKFEVSAISQCQSPVTVSCKPPSGSVFPLGETLVNCTAVDQLGNVANCTFTVQVVDLEGPSLFVPKSVEAKCTDWRGAIVEFNVEAEDACGEVVFLECNPPSGSWFPNGRTMVTCKATDAAGNISEERFPVTVVGDCGANCVSITCPGDQMAQVTSGTTVEVEFKASATHLCEGTITQVACTPPSGSAFPIGTNVVVCVAGDAHGNRAVCSFNVIVTDAVPPVLQMPDVLRAPCDQADGSAVVAFDIQATDNDDPAPTVSCEPPGGTRFPAGTNVVTCTAIDRSGNAQVGTFQVVVMPGSVCGVFPALPDAGSPDNWGFELGLVSWAGEGLAFARQPVTGNVLPVKQFPAVANELRRTVGGDYWEEVGYPVGHKGTNWIATGENIYVSPSQFVRLGGDELMGTLISKPFVVRHRYVTYLIGGDSDPGKLAVQVVKPTGDPNAPFPFVSILEDSGPGPERMARRWLDVGDWRGEELRIVIQDRSPKGHLNVDDFVFQDTLPSEETVQVGMESYPKLIFRNNLWYDWDAPVWGAVDLHTHPMTHLGFGQIVFHGEPDGPIEHALRDCNCSHGGPGLDNLCGNFFRNTLVSVMDGEGPDPHRWGYDPDPWLQFTKWPVFNSISHQQMWHEWIRRAYDGGLRVMVALTVNSRLLGSAALGTGPLDDRTVGDLQIAEIKRFAARHDDFMQIAYDPYEFREILNANKLAIIIGWEIDDMGNFDSQPGVTADQVRAEIRRLYNDGVRYFFPVHLTNNKLGGSAVYNDLFNVDNKFRNGVALSVTDAPASERIDFTLHKLDLLSLVDVEKAIEFAVVGPLVLPALASPVGDAVLNIGTPGFPPGAASGIMGVLAPAIPAALGLLSGPAFLIATDYLRDAGIPLDVLPIGGNYPDYSTNHHMNAAGLSTLGTNAVVELMRLGMMIDVDHMSQRTLEGTMALSSNIPSLYPLNSGHNTFRECRKHASENNRTPEQVDFVRRSCGLMGIGYGNEDMRAVDTVLPGRRFSVSHVDNNCAGTSRSFAQSYLYALDKMHGHQVALGTDINGFVMGPGPRFGPQSAFGLIEEAVELGIRPWQIQRQYNGVAYAPREGYPIVGPAFDGRAVDPDNDTDSLMIGDVYAFNKEQRDFFVALRIFKWNPAMSKTEADRFESRVSDKYDQRRVKELLKGLLIGVTDEAPGHDIWDGDVGTKQQIAKAVYRFEVLGEPIPDDVRNDRAKLDRFYGLRHVWEMYHRAYGDNTPLTRCQTGSKNWDYNFEGMAHYGLLPDFFQDLSNVGMEARDLTPLFNGAEHFARMWMKCLDRAEYLRPRFIPVTGIQIADGSVTLRYIDTADDYVLEAASSLAAPEWKPVVNAELARGVIVSTLTFPISAESRFFRLRKED